MIVLRTVQRSEGRPAKGPESRHRIPLTEQELPETLGLDAAKMGPQIGPVSEIGRTLRIEPGKHPQPTPRRRPAERSHHCATIRLRSSGLNSRRSPRTEAARRYDTPRKRTIFIGTNFQKNDNRKHRTANGVRLHGINGQTTTARAGNESLKIYEIGLK